MNTFTLMGGVWDVDAALALVANRPAWHTLSVADWIARFRLDTDRPLVTVDRAAVLSDALDLSSPLIVISVGRGTRSLLIIDGWEKLIKAQAVGVETLVAHVLTQEESARLRICP